MADSYSLENPDRSLELSNDAMEKMVEAATKKILEYESRIPDQPAFDFDGAHEVAQKLKEGAPPRLEDFESLLEKIFGDALGKGINFTSPGFMGYVPVGGLFHSAVAEFIATAINIWPGLYELAPGFVQLEANVVRWLCDMMGMPNESAGYLSSGGSVANFSAVVTARAKKLPENFLSGTLYTSDQAHHSIGKAATLAGFPVKNIRVVPTDEHFRISVNELRAQIKKDRDAGMLPFLIVANVGTTATGAVDPLEELGQIAAAENMWFHVDAAWAGAFRLTEHGRNLMRGIERADTITIDPHKALFLPYGCGALLARDGAALRQAHSYDASYLPTKATETELLNYSQISPELSRSLRGLQAWIPLKMHGFETFKNYMQEKLDLTFWATDELKKISNLRIVAHPQVAIVAFRYEKSGTAESELNKINQQLLERINRDKKIYLSGATLKGQFVIRICPFAYRTHKREVQTVLDEIRNAFYGQDRDV